MGLFSTNIVVQGKPLLAEEDCVDSQDLSAHTTQRSCGDSVRSPSHTLAEIAVLLAAKHIRPSTTTCTLHQPCGASSFHSSPRSTAHDTRRLETPTGGVNTTSRPTRPIELIFIHQRFFDVPNPLVYLIKLGTTGLPELDLFSLFGEFAGGGAEVGLGDVESVLF